MTTRKTGGILLASAVAGLMTLGTSAQAAGDEAAGKETKVHCYGVNACKGQGACAGAGHACGGKNACKGQGFVETESEAACLKMTGGRLTPNAAAQ